MQEIFKQYGGTILVCTAFVAITAMLFVFWPSETGSFLDDTGARVEERLEDHKLDWDSKENASAFDAHAERSKPTIHVDRHVRKGEHAKLDDFITIKDSDGNIWDTTRKSFTNQPNQGRVELLEVIRKLYTSDETESGDVKDEISYGPYYDDFTFIKHCTLLMTFRITDADGVQATYQVPVAVDRIPE